MLYRLMLSAALLLFAAGAIAQTAGLTGRVWKITEDQMTGLGKHESLPSGTTLEFYSDSTWTASASLRGATAGTWTRESDNFLRMTFGDDSKSRPVRIVALTEHELRFRVTYLNAAYTYSWKPE